MTNRPPWTRTLPWDCGCHAPIVFGHLEPCVWWERQPKAWSDHVDGYT